MKTKFTDSKKNWFRRILGTAGIFAALCLASCSNLIEEEKINVVDVKPDREGYVTLRIAVDETSFRATYHPEADTISAFTDFSLLCDGTKLGYWEQGDGLSAYNVMNSSSVRVKTGSHNFELVAGKDGIKYSGTKSVEITGSDTIMFNLSFSGISKSSGGKERINVTFPATASKLVIERYKYEDVTSRIVSDAEPVVTTVTSFTTTNGVSKYNPAEVSCSSGKYKYVFSFYAAGIADPLLSIPHIVYISAAQTTYVTFDITDFTDVYDITYFNTSDASYTGAVPLVYTSVMGITLPVPEKAHYVFGGWYETEDFSGTAVTGWTRGSRTGNVTLYAKWTPETYTVSFYSNVNADGSYSNSAFATQNITYNEYAAAPATAPQRSGYVLERWVEDGINTAFNFENTPITKDTKLYAIWKNASDGKVSYPVYFYYDDDTVYAAKTVAEGQTAAAPSAPSKEEFAFRGWYTEANRNSKDPGQSYNFSTAVTSALKLYASWCRTTYHVSSDGGETAGYDGSEALPYKTLKKALSMIEADSYAGGADYSSFTGNKDFTLVMHGDVVDNSGNEYYTYLCNSATYSSGSNYYRVQNIKSLTIRGASGAESDSFAVSGVLEITTDIPVKFANIKTKSGISIGASQTAASVTYASGTLCTAYSAVLNGSLVMQDGVELTASVSVQTETYNKPCSFTMNGGIIHNCTGNRGGAIYNSGTITMNGGIITGNTATYMETHSSGGVGELTAAGGGVYNIGTFTMNAGEITGNTAEVVRLGGYKTNDTFYAKGGGVYNTGNFYFYSGKISNNTASAYYSRTYGYDFEGTAKALGGGVYNEGTFSFQGSSTEISGNNASAYAYGSCSDKRNTGEVYADALGGGIYTTKDLSVQYGTISGNTLVATIEKGSNISFMSSAVQRGEAKYLLEASLTFG